MSSYFTPERIYNILIPPEVMDDESPGDFDPDLLAAKFRQIPACIDELERIILKATKSGSAERKQDLEAYPQNLLTLAKTFVAHGHEQFAEAGLQIVASVLKRKHADKDRAERVLEAYDDQYTNFLISHTTAPGAFDRIAALKQDPKKNAEEIEKTTASSDRVVQALFSAAALIPPPKKEEDVSPNSLHRRAERCLLEAAKHDLQHYAHLLITVAPVCFVSSAHPGGAAIVQHTYDTLVVEKRTAHDECLAAGKIDKAAKAAWELMFIDAGMIAQFHPIESLHERAAKFLHEHWLLLNEISPARAKEALKEFSDAYAAHDCREWFFDLGRKKLLASIETLKSGKRPEPPRPDASTQPASLPLQP